jgi:uncharacterized membrane protein
MSDTTVPLSTLPASGTQSNGTLAPEEFWQKLRLPHHEHNHPPVANANDVYKNSLSPLDKLAVSITDKVGSMGFFLAILVWTILWTTYNILASEVPGLHWKSFDPFPAFVAYLLISNVIQILLMPLIMVGQNVQGRHTEIRAQLDFEVNQKAEKEVVAILHNLEHNTDLLIQLMRHLECKVSDEEVRALAAERDIADKLEAARIEGAAKEAAGA